MDYQDLTLIVNKITAHIVAKLKLVKKTFKKNVLKNVNILNQKKIKFIINALIVQNHNIVHNLYVICFLQKKQI